MKYVSTEDIFWNHIMTYFESSLLADDIQLGSHLDHISAPLVYIP